MEDDDKFAAVSPQLRQQINERFPQANRPIPSETESTTPVTRTTTITKPVSTNIRWYSLSSYSPNTPVPEIGGLYKDLEGKLIPFVGTDPDAQVNVFSYNEALLDWECDVTKFEASYINKQGLVHMGQFHPLSIKDSHKMEEVCTSYVVVKFVGFRGRDSGIPPITQTI